MSLEVGNFVFGAIPTNAFFGILGKIEEIVEASDEYPTQYRVNFAEKYEVWVQGFEIVSIYVWTTHYQPNVDRAQSLISEEDLQQLYHLVGKTIASLDVRIQACGMLQRSSRLLGDARESATYRNRRMKFKDRVEKLHKIQRKLKKAKFTITI